MSEPIVELHDVSFSYGQHWVLRNINLQIDPGDFAAIIGPNGGGKTTLLKLIVGLITPTTGSVLLLGTTPSKSAHRVGYVPQGMETNQGFPIRVIDVVLMGRLSPHRSFHRFDRSDHAAAREALERMEMWELRHEMIGNLSGGQRQRVHIARALASKPEALFLDEPTANVDAQGQTDFYTHLKAINDDVTIVVVSHDLLVLSCYVQSVICVNQQLIHHHSPEVTGQMLRMGYSCPVELVAHGQLPHRVLARHEEEK